MRARQDENHWQSCWTDGKPDRNINLKFTIMKLKCRKWRHNVNPSKSKKGTLSSLITNGNNHRHSHAIYLYLRENLCSEFWSFSSFLFIDLANFNCPHLLFILNVNKYWKYSSIIPLSTLRNSKFSKAASNCACGVKRVIGSFMYDHWISNVHRRMTRVSYAYF